MYCPDGRNDFLEMGGGSLLYVVTGGSGSGKSAYAEDCIVELGDGARIYIATMYPFDEESRQRIARHRDMRKEKQFTTIECYTGLEHVRVPKGANVLLECMSNLVANEIYQDSGAKGDVVDAILRGIDVICDQASNLVVVTNEIFSDGIDYGEETTQYQEYLGQINVILGKKADLVTEVVFGIPIVLAKVEG